MSKIKNIYTFGTSFTKGGGFEFWSKYTKQKLNTAYSGLREDLNQHNFSWPGQLEKIINDINKRHRQSRVKHVFNFRKKGCRELAYVL